MIHTIGDYENWRDSQHDRPIPDSEGPDERRVRRYTHDYPGDTVLEYTVSGNRTELRLAFSSEDPDMGTEEMIYGGDNGESMCELAADLRAELSAYLDYEDTSSFSRQQSLSRPPGIHSKAFRDEFQDVVNGLRRENGLLRSFSVMSKKCRDGLPGEESFSFQGQTANHLYCLRCIPRRGDYNFYLYAYDKNILREQDRKQSQQAQESMSKKPHKTRKNEMER